MDALRRICEINGIDAQVERSRSGRGAHVWIFFSEAVLAVNKDETMIVVAIGQYIGEGFNYPRLDTMLLAMPISFEENVEQYAGRLNRDYEGKKDVVIFDYIDQHIFCSLRERCSGRDIEDCRFKSFIECTQGSALHVACTG